MPKFEVIKIPQVNGPTVEFFDLVPNRASNGVFFWRVPAIMQHTHPATRPTFSVSNTQPSKNTKYQRTRLKLVLPVPKKDAAGNWIENVVDHTLSFNIEIDVPDAASTDSRNELINMLSALVATDNGIDFLQALVTSGEGIYA